MSAITAAADSGSPTDIIPTPSSMTLQSGARLGPYEILSPLGAGGMGEVYKARDTRLDRTVAIKVLPDSTRRRPAVPRALRSRSPRDLAAQSSAHLHAVRRRASSDGTAFLVMEYLEGETLAERLAKGALPLDQALKTAIEIASALDKAHRAGIVHRDLKPGNIMLTKGGAKLLDFGLAKCRTPVVAGAGQSMLPTAPANLTAQGTILGTFQYMAPEQLEGQEADARTDIFAFGAVLYEMVTGSKAFEGKTQREPDRGDSQGRAAAGVNRAAALSRIARSRRQEVSREGSGRALAVRSRSPRRTGVDRG